MALVLAFLPSQMGSLAEVPELQTQPQEDVMVETVNEPDKVEPLALTSSADKQEETNGPAGDQQTTGNEQTTGNQQAAGEQQSTSQQNTLEEQTLYTVCFYDYDGTELELLHQDVIEGGFVEEPKWTPMHEGLAFRYWFDEENEMQTPFQFAWEPVYKELRLIARYELIPSYYGTDTQFIPEGFDESGMSGAPDMPSQNKPAANVPVVEETPTGTVIEDGNLKGTVVDHVKGAGFIVSIIHISEEESEEGEEPGNDEGFVVSIIHADEEESEEGEEPNNDEGYIVSITRDGEESEESEEPGNDEGYIVSITHADEEKDEEGEEPSETEESEASSEDNEDSIEGGEFEEGEELDESEEPGENEELEIDGDVFVKLEEQRSYKFGETVTLQGSVEGFEGAAGLAYQWRYSLDGENWVDMKGATELTYSFTLTEENQFYQWQLMVFGTAPAQSD